MKQFSLITALDGAASKFCNGILLLSLVASVLTLWGCSNSPDEPEPIIDPVEEPVGRAVLVYMVANNNLGSAQLDTDLVGYDNADIAEMRQAAAEGAFGTNRLILYHAPYKLEPQLVEVTADTLKVLKDYDLSVSSITSARMNEVMDDFKRLVPARAYGLILWSHATGWEQTGINEELTQQSSPQKSAYKESSPQKAFGLDGGRWMNVTTLAKVLEGKEFDYVYFDCCHMAGVEVAYELRHATDHIVGSCSELPSEGMPYHLTLPFLMSDEPNLEGAAAATFNHYDAMTRWRRTCTMSVINTTVLDELASEVRQFYTDHKELPEGYSPQKFIKNNCRYFDLEDYLQALASVNPTGEEELAPVLDALHRAVTYGASTPYLWEGQSDEVAIKSHCGLSTFILKSPLDVTTRGYNQLSWYADVASALF